MPDMFFLILGIIFAALGLIILTVNLVLLLRCNLKIDAKIIAINKIKNTLRGTTVYSYNPSVSYNVGGMEYKCKAPFSTKNESKYVVGNTIPLCVCEKKPELCRFKGQIGIVLFGLIPFVIGLTFIILFFI